MSPGLVFLVGLVLLVVGAEILLRGAASTAAMLGIRPILIGLTVVSVGTSAPELAVGIAAAAEGKGGLAVGNIAGTNLLNILFILGLSAALRPLPLHLRTLKLDVPVMAASAIVLLGMAWDGVLTRAEGAALVGASVIYTIVLIRTARNESAQVRAEFAEEYAAPPLEPGQRPRLLLWNGVLLIAGIVLCVYGAELLVEGAEAIARAMGVSDAIIGLTIVAIGTSAPELVTTLVATWKDDRDVAVGNLIGSSTSNILVILGLTCVASPLPIVVTEDVIWFDLPLGALVAVACWPVFRSDHQVSRTEGIAFVLAYVAYLSWLILVRA